jgi:transcription elongation factor GreA
MQEKVYKLTKEGYKQIEKNLKVLKTKERAEIAERIRQAKEFGQLEENTEYENAKEEQAKIEREIMKLEEILRNATILDKKDVQTDKVDIGTTVTVEFVEDSRNMQFEIVSSQESNPGHEPPRISDESPIGSALMGKSKGEVVEVEVPLGIVHYKVVEILNTI